MQVRWPLVPRASAVLLLALVVGLAACGGDHRSASRGSKPPPTGATSYVGLTKQEAIEKATADRRPWRIAREDDEHYLLTQDYVPNRVTFEIDKGTVTRATFG